MKKNYWQPQCTVLEFKDEQEVVRCSNVLTGQTDNVDTYMTWGELFGGEA